MNIAVVFFGQPRFVDKTWKSIKQEFTFEGAKTDYFFHFWDKTGFNSKREEETDINQQDIINWFQPVAYEFTDYTDLVEESVDMLDFVNIEKEKINKDRISSKNIYSISKPEHLHYFLGQFVSMKKGFNLLTDYSHKNNIKYDVVFRVRTDLFFVPPKFENLEQEKESYYLYPLAEHKKGVFCTPGSLRAWIDHKTYFQNEELIRVGPAEDLVLASFVSFNNKNYYTLREYRKVFFTENCKRVTDNITLHVKDWLLWGDQKSLTELCTNCLDGLREDILNCTRDLNNKGLNYDWGAGELVNGETLRVKNINCYEVPIGIWSKVKTPDRFAKVINKYSKENLHSLRNVVRDDWSIPLEHQYRKLLRPNDPDYLQIDQIQT